MSGKIDQRRFAATAPSPSGQPEVGAWPLSDMREQEQLEAWFASLGVDPTKPGVHDTREFLRAEQQDPMALNMLARLVEARHYGVGELKEVERRILIAAEAVAGHVGRDPRYGLCVVASGVLSRILDELGVWNYTAKTNLAIYFPRSISPEPRYFYSIDEGSFVAPHAVVVAPPFVVIDVSLRQQKYDREAMGTWLPAMVTATSFLPYQVSLRELVSPMARAMLRSRGLTVERYLAAAKKDMLDFMAHLPAREVHVGGGRLGYALVAAGGYQEQLRELHGQNCSINGREPMDIFERDVVPRL